MTGEGSVEKQQLWPMGAVTRRTGIGEHTLRAWERRFGFPNPVRLPSGHRRYPHEQVRHLLKIAQALDFGYRAGDIVALPLPELEEMLKRAGVLAKEADAPDVQEIFSLVFDSCKRFDRERLTALLQSEAALLGLPVFLRERVAPLLNEIGEAWGRGDIEIRHEHFVSEILEDVLRTLRAPLESAAKGRPVALASLPNELHGLGIQVAALAIVASGRSARILGPHLPVEEIVQAAAALDAVAVGLSVSIFANPDETSREIDVLRKRLPGETALWVGGTGAELLQDLPSGVDVAISLDDLDRMLIRLSD